MKKLVFMFVAFATISFASCGNKTEQGNDLDSDSIEDISYIEKLPDSLSNSTKADTDSANIVKE
jgi:hypothetical protein